MRSNNRRQEALAGGRDEEEEENHSDDVERDDRQVDYKIHRACIGASVVVHKLCEPHLLWQNSTNYSCMHSPQPGGVLVIAAPLPAGLDGDDNVRAGPVPVGRVTFHARR